MLLCLPLTEAAGQQFWEPTGEFPGGPKTGIAVTGDSILFAGLTDGIIRSRDGGNSFETVLGASGIFSLYATASGSVLAGGTGKIYVTGDGGDSWDSMAVNSAFPVIQITENGQGALFAITGGYDDEGYKGNGVFYAPGPGHHWEQRNGGLGSFLGCEKIAADKNGRLYLAVHDHFVTGNGGLFISGDNGLKWEHVDVRIDGRGQVEDRLRIEFSTGLSVSPQDSVYLSFQGLAGNGMVRLNVRRHTDDVGEAGHWTVCSVTESEQWWLDRTLHNIYFSGNGLWFSSSQGSLNTGGTWYTREGSGGWEQVNQNLEYYPLSHRDAQYFAEDGNGRIYMVQHLGEKIFTHTGQGGPVTVPQRAVSGTMVVYPNPAGSGQPVYLAGSLPRATRISLFDNTGRKLADPELSEQPVRFSSPAAPGIYYIAVEGRDHREVIRFIVR